MATTKWAIDAAHTEIQFKVKHMMITNVTGTFDKYEAEIVSDGENFTDPKISFTADTATVNTKNEQRDVHLKSADFFDAENHPQIKFVSTSFTRKIGDDYQLAGNLTINGITKSITLDVELGGIAKDPWGNTKAGFTITGKINRKEWGLNWNAALEAGGILVSEDVRILCSVQLVKGA